MSTQLAIPEHLKRFISSPSSSNDAGAMAAASMSIPRISLKGRKFRLMEGGEEIRKPSDEIFVVILSVEPGPGLMQKSYYKSGYVSGSSAPPDCSSTSGVMPDTWVAEPIAPKCSTCPMNVFGSAISTNGKKTKACRDSKRLWVVEPDNLDGTVYALNVPVSSLKAMAEYGSMLAKQGIPPAAVISRLSMVDSEFPQIQFDFLGFLEEDVLVKSMNRHEQQDWTKPTAPMLDYDRPTSTGPIQAPGAQQLLESQSKTKTEAVGEAPTVPGGSNDELGAW